MNQVASEYASALYSLAHEENILGEIFGEMREVQQLLRENPDFIKILDAPMINKEEKQNVLKRVFAGQVHAYLLNFLCILSEKRLAYLFSDCCAVFKERYDFEHHIQTVVAVTAVPMSEQLQERLRERLHTLTGQTIELENRVDASIMGGMRLEYEGQQMDGTVKSKLDALRLKMQRTLL